MQNIFVNTRSSIIIWVKKQREDNLIKTIQSDCKTASDSVQ